MSKTHLWQPYSNFLTVIRCDFAWMNFHLFINNSNIDAWYNEISFANLAHLQENQVIINNPSASDQNLPIIRAAPSQLLILTLFINGYNRNIFRISSEKLNVSFYIYLGLYWNAIKLFLFYRNLLKLQKSFHLFNLLGF